MLGIYNSTFLVLIHKVDFLATFDEFELISLCNYLYKIIYKVIAIRIKPLLFNVISSKQFGFLKGRHIHEVIITTQKSLHSIKKSQIHVEIIKIDLFKSYDMVYWLYIMLLLTQMGLDLPLVKWITDYLASSSFIVLINGCVS